MSYFTGPRPAYVPTTKKLEKVWIARSKSYVASCVKKAGALLGHITTEDLVKDMDAIRAALGQSQINYLGYSYGALLGQTYGTVFPTHLRRAIFNSNVDLRKDWYEAGYVQSVWPSIAQSASAWITKGDKKALGNAYETFGAESDDNGYAGYLAASCNESQWPSHSVSRADSWGGHRVTPFETWGNSWHNAGCIYWPLKYQAPVEIDGSKVESALLIDETLDAATPYSGSLETRKRFPELGAAGRAGWHEPRELARRQRVRRQRDRSLPAGRNAAGPEGGQRRGQGLQAAAAAEAGEDLSRRLGAGRSGASGGGAVPLS